MRTLIGILGVLLGVCGCESPTHSVAIDLPLATWDTACTIPIQNEDTTTLRDVRIFMRTNHNFNQDSLTVSIATYRPDSLRCEEDRILTFDHKRMATALQREIVVGYRRGVVYDQRGVYRLEIKPHRAVQGIEAIGINIVKSE